MKHEDDSDNSRTGALEVADILDRLKGGDESVLRAILEKYGPLIMNLLGRYPSLTIQDKEDVWAVTLNKLWKSRNLYAPSRSAFKTWVCTLAKNAAIDLIRARVAKTKAEQKFAGCITESSLDPAQQFADVPGRSQSDVADLEHILSSFSEEDLAVLDAWLYRDGEEAWEQKVATSLDMSPGSVRVRCTRIFKRIRSEMQKRGHYVT